MRSRGNPSLLFLGKLPFSRNHPLFSATCSPVPGPPTLAARLCQGRGMRPDLYVFRFLNLRCRHIFFRRLPHLISFSLALDCACGTGPLERVYSLCLYVFPTLPSDLVFVFRAGRPLSAFFFRVLCEFFHMSNELSSLPHTDLCHCIFSFSNLLVRSQGYPSPSLLPVSRVFTFKAPFF